MNWADTVRPTLVRLPQLTSQQVGVEMTAPLLLTGSKTV